MFVVIGRYIISVNFFHILLYQEEYKATYEANKWHRKVELPNGETVIFHSADTFILFPAQAVVPEVWNNSVNVSIVFTFTILLIDKYLAPMKLYCHIVSKCILFHNKFIIYSNYKNLQIRLYYYYMSVCNNLNCNMFRKLLVIIHIGKKYY